MKTTSTNKYNASIAIKDALELLKLVSKMDTAKTTRSMFKAADAANEYAESLRKRHGRKNVIIFTRINPCVKRRFNYRITDITVKTGKSSNIIISERRRTRVETYAS